MADRRVSKDERRDRRRTSNVVDTGRRSSAYHALPENMERVQRSMRDVLRLLGDVPMLRDLHERERGVLAEIAEIVRCPGGTVLYEPGQAGTHLYIILQGRVEIRARVGPGIFHGVRVLEDGEAAGLDAALGGNDYHMQARSLEKTAALRFRTDALRTLIEAGRPAGVKLFGVLSNELGVQIRNSTVEVVRLLAKTSMRMTANANKREGEYSDADLSKILGG